MAGKTARRSADRLRLEVAAEAARIIATEGQRSYLAAKQKAAQRLGASTRGALPSNAQIEQALKEWQMLYGGDEHAARLQALREAALEAMDFLAEFRPKLVGPVLEGTADEFSRICLHLYSEDPDSVVRFLMENGIAFDQERRRIRWHDGGWREIDVLVVEAGEETVEMALMIGREALQAPPSPIDGRPLRRASRSDLQSLVDGA
ncbi:MAG: hypothetical protein EA419_07975 [Wenzhouxiangella sp.]|nr:MAG: hypothetical protein EA419_07975 [Wenzhouxiangella sp.]